MKEIAFNLLYSIHLISPQKGIYHSRIYPFVVSFKSVKRLVDWCMIRYHKWYNFTALLEWRNGWAMKSKDVWHRVFDWSLGVWLESPEHARSLEKQTGMERVTFADFHTQQKKERAKIDSDWQKEIQGDIKNIVREVKQGRKYTHESRVNRERIMREHGLTRLPGVNR
jgi:hypothetical protein